MQKCIHLCINMQSSAQEFRREWPGSSANIRRKSGKTLPSWRELRRLIRSRRANLLEALRLACRGRIVGECVKRSGWRWLQVLADGVRVGYPCAALVCVAYMAHLTMCIAWACCVCCQCVVLTQSIARRPLVCVAALCYALHIWPYMWRVVIRAWYRRTQWAQYYPRAIIARARGLPTCPQYRPLGYIGGTRSQPRLPPSPPAQTKRA